MLAPIASNKIRSFRRELPQMTKRLADLPFIGRRFRDANTSAKIERWLQQLPHDLNRNSAKIGRTILGAADAAFAVLVVVTLAFAFSIDGPRLLRSARRSFSPATRRRFDQSCRVTSEVVGRYFAGTVFVASLAGINALIVGLALGVVLAPLAAIWIAVTNVIPQIGGFLGGVVLVALGFASGTGAGLGCLVYFLVYQQFENHVIQPAVIGRAVEMSPAATMLTALVGGSALGLPGALISVPLVGAAKSVTRQLAGPRAPAKPSADEPRPTRRSQLRR